MNGNGGKYVWVLRGDLGSKHQGLESKIPHNPLNIEFIFQRLNFGRGWLEKWKTKHESRDWRL